MSRTSNAITKGKLAGLAAALLIASIESRAQSVQSLAPGKSEEKPEIKARVERRIVVSIPDHKLAVIEDGKIVKIYAVAVGAKVSPSPAGEFKVINRLSNPAYYAPGVMIPPGKQNPLGPRWIGLNLSHFGIHGTNQPRSIGRHASHGCVRMRNADVEELFEWVQVGDTVVVAGERTAEIAQIFGGAPSAVLTASAQKEPANTQSAESSGDAAAEQKANAGGQQQ